VMRKGSGTLNGAAFVGWDSTYSFNATGRRIPVEHFSFLTFPRAPMSGVADITADGRGTFESPEPLTRPAHISWDRTAVAGRLGCLKGVPSKSLQARALRPMSRVPSLSSPFLLGFDEIERVLDRVAKGADGYPPYNIERLPRD